MSVRSVVKVGGSLCADPARLRALLAALADGAFGPCLVVPGGGADADAVRLDQARLGFDDAEAHRRALDAMSRMAARFHAIEPRLPVFVRSCEDLRLHEPAEEAPGEPRGPLSHGERVGVTGVTSPDRSHPSPGPSPARERGPAIRFATDATTVSGLFQVATNAGREGSLPSGIWDPAALRAGHPDIPESWDVTSDSLALWAATQIRAPRCILAKSADAPAGADARDLARIGLVDAAFPAFAARYGGALTILGPSGERAVAIRAAA